jgi:hypothetical protein
MLPGSPQPKVCDTVRTRCRTKHSTYSRLTMGTNNFENYVTLANIPVTLEPLVPL